MIDNAIFNRDKRRGTCSGSMRTCWGKAGCCSNGAPKATSLQHAVPRCAGRVLGWAWTAGLAYNPTHNVLTANCALRRGK